MILGPRWLTTVRELRASEKLPDDLMDLVPAAVGLSAVVNVLLALGMLLSTPLWCREGVPGTLRVALGPVEERPRWWRWVMAGLTLLTLVECLPRMDRSLWGDETMALRGYVTGHLSCSAKDHLQGKIKFVSEPWWHTVFSDDSGGNNHYLYSIIGRATLDAWRKATGAAPGAISEAVLRFWPLVAGLAALWALAGWVRRLGLPAWVAVLAAALLAVHPWHLRFSGEARGYMLMVLLFTLTLHAWVDALERGRWRDWIGVAVGQFLSLYAWKGVLYPLLGVNLVVAALMLTKLRGTGRQITVGRWLAVNCMSGGIFVPLVALAQVQMAAAIPAVVRRGNEPLSLAWVENLFCESVLGYPARISQLENPLEISFQRLWQAQPWLVAAAAAVIVLVLLVGLVGLLRRSPVLGWLLLAVPAGGMLAAVHFKLLMNIELLRWYWLFCCPVVAVWMAAGAAQLGGMAAGAPTRRVAAVAVALLAFAGLTWPIRHFHLTHPFEASAEALEVARGKGYRPWNDRLPNHVKTVWLWRHPALYDPRGEHDAGSADQVRAHLEEARRAQMEFYFINGYPSLTRAISPEVQALLDDPRLFEKVTTFWAQMPQQTLDIYRALPQPGPAAPR